MRLSKIAKVSLLFLAATLGAVAILSKQGDAMRSALAAILRGADAKTEIDKPDRGETKEPEQKSTDQVQLTAGQIKLIGLKTAVVEQSPVTIDLLLNGEIAPNQDRTVEVLSRTAGVVREVKKTLGDRVRANEPIAVIDSRDLAEAVATYLGARSKVELTQTQFEREESLWEKKVSSEQDYLTAKQAATAAAIELRAAEQKLTLLGLDPKKAAEQPPGSRGSVEVPVAAPFDGTIIEKRVAVGDQVTDQTPLFRIANLDRVWVIANVFEKDVARVAVGQPATVTLKAYPDRKFEGQITWVSEVIEESTRTLKVRIELDNHDRLLKPGSFAHVLLKIVARESVVTVPASAIQRQKSDAIVFVDAGAGLYKRREVKLGIRSPEAVEVTAGLAPGETVVTSGSFILKSEFEKSSFGDND